MIMRIRVNEPFTLPQNLNKLIVKNKKVLIEYFHKHIINSDKLMHCTLCENSFKQNVDLQNLARELNQLLYNLPFEAYCVVRSDNVDKMNATGINLPSKNIFARRIFDELQANDHSSCSLKDLKRLVSSDSFNLARQFFMPLTDNYMSLDDAIYYGGKAASDLLREEFPNDLELLREKKSLYLIKCVIRYQHFATCDKLTFIVEIIKHFGYKMFSDYDYTITFCSSTTHNISANRIIDIKKLL